MPNFKVVIKDNNKKNYLFIEAANSVEAMKIAEEKYEVFPIQATLVDSSKSNQALTYTNRKLKFKEVLFIFQEIYILISSGITLKDSLLEVEKSTDDEKVKLIVNQIIQGLNQGKTFSSLVGEHYQQKSIVISVLKVGEKGGDLDKILNVIINYLEDTDKNVSSIVKALSYPLILIVFTFMALILMLVYVIPQFEEIFKSFGNELPVYTAVLLDMSNFVRANSLLLLLGVISVPAALFFRYKTHEPFQKRIDTILVKHIFILSNTLHLSAMYKITSSLEILLSSGINALEALNMVLSSTGNLYIREKLDYTIAQIKIGSTLAKALRESGLFKNSTIRLIVAGENSGKTPEMMQRVAGVYRKELNAYVETISKLIEPFLLIIIAMIVLFIALSIFMPIWSLSSGI